MVLQRWTTVLVGVLVLAPAMTVADPQPMALPVLVALALAALALVRAATVAEFTVDGDVVAARAREVCAPVVARQADPGARGRVRARAPGRGGHRTGRPPR